MPSQRLGPSRLFLIRHSQSAGNLAADEARRGGAARLALETRDMDVALCVRTFLADLLLESEPEIGDRVPSATQRLLVGADPTR